MIDLFKHKKIYIFLYSNKAWIYNGKFIYIYVNFNLYSYAELTIE